MGNPEKTSTPVVLSAYAMGLLLGLGLGLGGMCDPTKVISFFSADFESETFDPSLGIMFVTALLTNAVLYHLIQPFFGKPMLASNFSIPTNTQLTVELFAGAAMFGTGWAISGYCPGPGIVAAATHEKQTWIFCVAMLSGMALFKLTKETRVEQKPGKAGAYGAIAATVVAVAYIMQLNIHVPATRDASTFLLHPFWPVVGGICVGSSVGLMMIVTGEILGISGIISGIFSGTTGDKLFRVAFLSGLVSAGFLFQSYAPETITNHLQRPWQYFAIGGFLVGYGTSLGSGCTSGHGIAGLARLSRRSVAAVTTFFVANILVTRLLSDMLGIGQGWISNLV